MIIGIFGIFLIFVGMIALEPLLAFMGFFIILPFILTYVVVFLVPKYIQYIEKKKDPPEFDFPNHSVVHNMSGPSEQVNESWDMGPDEKTTGNERETSSVEENRLQKIRDAENSLKLTQPYTEEELTKAYKSLVKDTHPDTENGSKRRFIEVQEAYELLLEHESYSDDE